jgi:hypothetical protein
MHALQQAFAGQVAQVAADRVFRQAQFLAQRFGDDLPILARAGYRVGEVRKVFEAFMSPGSVTERLYFFVGEYDAASRTGDGGGIAEEGEDIEVLELPMAEAQAMVADGRIADGKTIMLLQYAALHLLAASAT